MPAGLTLPETEDREGRVLVPAGDGEAPGQPGQTGAYTGTSIRGREDAWEAGGVTWYRRTQEVTLNTGDGKGGLWEGISKREGFEEGLKEPTGLP